MMGLRKVRSEVTTVRKEGVVLNGTEKVNFLTVDMSHVAAFLKHFSIQLCFQALQNRSLMMETVMMVTSVAVMHVTSSEVHYLLRRFSHR